MSGKTIDREIFANFMSNYSCPAGCMRKKGHSGLHTTSPEIAKKLDEEDERMEDLGELQ